MTDSAPDSDAPTGPDLDGLIGLEAAESRLLEAWTEGRMHHAWLLSGPAGIGKATLAHRLARFVLAEGATADGNSLFAAEDTPRIPQSLSIDPELAVARRVASRAHPDLLVIERSVNPKTKQLRREIVVEDVAALGAFLRLTSAEGGWRVVIVDSVDEMNRNAINAMLKLLEEPPPRALLVLVSHAPGRLPATIRSRCRSLAMPPLDDESVARVVRQRDPDLDEDTLRLAVRLAEGSIGRAHTIATGDGLAVLLEAVRALDGAPPVNRGRMLAACETWVRKRAGEEGDQLPGRLAIILAWLGQGVRRIAAGTEERGEAEGIAGESRVFHALVDRFGLAGCCARLGEADRLLRRGVGLNLDRAQMTRQIILTLAD